MTGIVNSTGARSGIIGTTVGTPTPTVAAGTAIQTVQFEVSDDNILTMDWENLWENSFTLKSASSDVFGWMCFQSTCWVGSGLGVKMFRNTSATVTDSHTAVWSKNVGWSGNPSSIYFEAGSGSSRAVSTIPFKDSLSGFSVGNTLYYGFFARKESSAAVHLPQQTSGPPHENGFMSLILMEVQK